METLDKHFRMLTKAAFEKHGFASADLLSHWPEIVGPDHAALATPERITWPRTTDKTASPAGTLTLRASPGRALEVQYMVQSIMERINAYLGYGAIAKIKVQASGPSANAAPPTPPPLAESPVSPRIEAVEDPDLKLALARLEHGIRSEKSRSPQGQSGHGLSPKLQVGKPT